FAIKESEGEKQRDSKVAQISHISSVQQVMQQGKKGMRFFASPLARRLATQVGLDLSLVSGSGPHGRIIKRDVEKAMKGGVSKASYS
ncbi:E3 binding domain-containing protein, partial [Bartonella sp. AA5SXTY]